MSTQVRNEIPMPANWHASREHKALRVVLITLFTGLWKMYWRRLSKAGDPSS